MGEGQRKKEKDMVTQAQNAMRHLLEGLAIVGMDSPVAQINWLMDFAGRDLSVPGAIEAARWQIYAFCTANFIRTAVEVKDHLVTHSLPKADNLEAWINPVREEEVLSLQHQLRQHLRELRLAHAIQFSTPLVHGIAWSPKQGAWMETRGKTASDLFFTAFVQLLLRVGKELRVCQRSDCERFFLATRPHQKYCSKRCENAVAVAKFRQAREESQGTQLRQPRKKQKAK